MAGRVALAAVLVVSTLALTTSTGGASSAALERGLHSRVAPDEEAYLGFHQVTRTTNGSTNLTVRVTNHLSTDAPLTRVSLTVDGEQTPLAGDGDLGPGESVSRRVPFVDCGDQLTVVATGPETRIALERRIDCH